MNDKRVTVPAVKAMKRGQRIGMLTAYDFPGAQVVRLEQNYRSTQTILDAANGVIAHNVSRKGKTLYTRRVGGERSGCSVRRAHSVGRRSAAGVSVAHRSGSPHVPEPREHAGEHP